VALGAEIDEGSLKAGLHAGNTTLVDIGLFLLAGPGFDIQVEQALAIDQCDTQLFRLSCVY